MSDETIIILPAFLKSFRTLVDGSVNVSFDINKSDPSTLSKIITSHQKTGYLAFKVGEKEGRLQETLAKLPQIEFEEGKSKSQRLRAVLYRSWEQESKGYTVFDDYYNSMMEQIITFYKNKLE